MAKINITFNEYRKYIKELRREVPVPSVIRIIFWILYIFILIECYIYELYILGIIFILIFFIIRFMNSKLLLLNRYKNHYLQNKFLNSDYEIEFKDRVINIHSGLNKLTFAVYDIKQIAETKKTYFFIHHSGFKLMIPKKFLNTDEINFVLKYRSQLEKRFWKN